MEASQESESHWRRLGQLLLEAGLIEEADLEYALAIQRQNGGLLGEILVTCGFVTSHQIAEALGSQHSVRLSQVTQFRERRFRVPPAPARKGEKPWTPLGRLLVERGLLTESGLERALVDQLRTGRLLGEIVVSRGWVSPEDLTRAIAEQQGGEPDGAVLAEPSADAGEGDETFEVCSNGVVLHTSPTFLDAADLAFDLVEREEPGTVEIVQVLGEQRQRIWSCARPRAELGSSASTWGTGWPLARHGKGVA